MKDLQHLLGGLWLGAKQRELLRRVAVVLFVAAVPVFLIASNVRWVINAPLLYSYGFDKHDIVERTGIERSELLSAARQIRDYFNNGEEFLVVSVVQRGVQVPSLFNSREILHMKDVKGLVRGVYRIQEATGAYLAVFAVVGLIGWRRRFLPHLARYVGLGGAATLGLAVLAGVGALIGFERLFLVFHLVSFSNDLWQLDPRRDYLLIMFPGGFFLDATIWIAGSTVVEALVLAAVPVVFLGWRPGRARKAARTLTAEAQAR